MLLELPRIIPHRYAPTAQRRVVTEDHQLDALCRCVNSIPSRTMLAKKGEHWHRIRETPVRDTEVAEHARQLL